MSTFQQLAIPTPQLQDLLQEHYGLTTQSIKRLNGEVDFNYHIKTSKGEQFLLKISRPDYKLLEINLQTHILTHLSHKKLPLELQKPIFNRKGKSQIEIKDQADTTRIMRLLTWVDGRMFAFVNPHTEVLLESLGAACGYLCKGLQGFQHSAAHRYLKWNPSEVEWIEKELEVFNNEEERELVHYFLENFQRKVLPYFPKLRKSIIHGDANDYNIVVSQDKRNPKIISLIDFGDSTYTHTINELGIALSYAMMDKADPIAAAYEVVRGFHQIFPLREEEIEVLFWFTAARSIITVTAAALNKRAEPENEYHQISARPAWDLLRKLRQVQPDYAHYRFRQACELEPCPKRNIFNAWLYEKPTFANIIDTPLTDERVTWLDLSVGSRDLGHNSDFDSIPRFKQTINRILAEKDAQIGIGGYGEVRPFYTTDAYIVEGNNGPQWRTTHLGLDIWAKTETPIYAPLEGKIHSFQNNANSCDYGPTIILEHEINEELTFYTLYGHLSLDSLEGLEVGQKIEAGQALCCIGDAPINGDWPPHLHFQVILDLLDKEGDFPGVGFYEERDMWLSLCPNPADVLPDFPHKNEDKATLEISEILAKRKEKLGKGLSVSYQKPLKIVRAYNQYLYDHTGRRYLDTPNNVPHVGHQNTKVVQAAQRQMAVLNTNTRYLHDEIIHFAEELLATFPDELCVAHFVNSGSEANELALRMARTYSNAKDVIAVEVGYHGNTGGTVDISSYKFDGKGGKGAPNHTHIVPIPDTYRGLYRGENNAENGRKYAAHIQDAIENLAESGRGVAAFICESILSCGGQVVLPEGYLKAVYQYVHAAGGLCIADEVQVGMGRVGDTFWGFELQGVIPDIVTIGKPIGNGHPLAAVVCTRAVADAFANGMEYFNTFGGNPVSCAIGRAVLRVVQDEKLQQNALETGKYIERGLHALKKQFPLMGDVRGHGFFLGFELVKNRVTLEPAAEQTTYLANRMRELGVLISTDGPFHNVIKIKPPMCFNRENSDFLLKTLERVLQEDFMQVETMVSAKNFSVN